MENILAIALFFCLRKSNFITTFFVIIAILVCYCAAKYGNLILYVNIYLDKIEEKIVIIY